MMSLLFDSLVHLAAAGTDRLSDALCCALLAGATVKIRQMMTKIPTEDIVLVTTLAAFPILKFMGEIHWLAFLAAIPIAFHMRKVTLGLSQTIGIARKSEQLTLTILWELSNRTLRDMLGTAATLVVLGNTLAWMIHQFINVSHKTLSGIIIFGWVGACWLVLQVIQPDTRGRH